MTVSFSYPYAPLIPEGYIMGLGRDHPAPRLAHLYHGSFADPGLPMCRRGWNRDDGQAYSIWRGNTGKNGVCKICLRRAHAGLPGVEVRPETNQEALWDAYEAELMRDGFRVEHCVHCNRPPDQRSLDLWGNHPHPTCRIVPIDPSSHSLPLLFTAFVRAHRTRSCRGK